MRTSRHLTSRHLRPAPEIADDWALLLDVDGTLLDFAPTPDAVVVPAGLVDTLQSLQQKLDGALALVSGRPLAQLDRLFAPLQLPAAGLHGLEMRHDTTRATTPAPPVPLQALLHKAQSLVNGYPGALVEDKGATVALHWRGNRDAKPALMSLAEAALTWLPGYHLQPGDQVLELRPDGADKGVAIAALIATDPFRGRRPVFVGDDLTDEHGFRVVREHAGLAVLVGDRQPSAADHRLADPTTVRDWLCRGAGRETAP
ncbi:MULTISPECIES: trehalose-phosphatase [unclassified Lysobacter]